MNIPVAPIAYHTVHADYSTTIVALYPYRVDWYGYSQLACRTYHLLAFDVDEGATEENVKMPVECAPIMGRQAAEAAFRRVTGQRIPEWAFEGRVG